MHTESTPTLFSVTEVELIYRNKTKPSNRRRITTSKDAYDLLLMSWEMNKIELIEQFKILLLDRSNSCIGISNVSIGGVSSCVVDPKIIFATALKARASGLILAHNHPSGNLKPSSSDIDLTKKLNQGGKFLEIEILDHLIVTPENYYSMADEGLMP
ncbi:MAG: JAB domain-containing protein [Bacteroidota bacterium]